MTTLRGRQFTSGEAKKAFENAFNEKIPLSTVSTYLSRLADRGILERLDDREYLLYRVSSEPEKQSLVSDSSHQS